jgi:hypothetical protein
MFPQRTVQLSKKKAGEWPSVDDLARKAVMLHVAYVDPAAFRVISQ